MGCPKCGYSGHNSVYHWGTDEIECQKCRHDYIPERKSSKKKDESFDFLTRGIREPYTYLHSPNDVWLSPSGKASVDGKALGSKYIGQVVNGRVVDHRGSVIGSVDLMGNFERFRGY